MGKANKGRPTTVPKKDEYSRVNYLYQAATTLGQNKKYAALSRGYSRNSLIISQKAVLKMAPLMKRSMCKRCNRVYVPGRNVSIRVENASRDKTEHNDVLVYECECGERRRYPVGRSFLTKGKETRE